MANKLTQYWTKITGKQVTNADVLNAIRAKASDNYKSEIGELEHLTQINHANIPYTTYEVHTNEFFSILINKIGTSVYKALSYEQPFSMFMSEMFDAGETMEEVYVGLAEEEQYNAKDTESPFKYRDTDIKVFYHDINRESKFVRTINKQWSLKAFTSEQAFDEFIDKMFTSLLSSDQLAIYERVKLLIPQGLTPVNVAPAGSPAQYIYTPATRIDTTQDNYMEEFNKTLLKRSNLFTVPSTTRFENAAGVPQATPKDDQYLIISADFSAELDSLVSNAYHKDLVTVMAHRIIVDEFPEYTGAGTLTGAKPICALVSKKSLILKDKMLEMHNIFNPNTLNYNYFLHHHQLISYSLLENSHVYYTMDDGVLDKKTFDINVAA